MHVDLLIHVVAFDASIDGRQTNVRCMYFILKCRNSVANSLTNLNYSLGSLNFIIRYHKFITKLL